MRQALAIVPFLAVVAVGCSSSSKPAAQAPTEQATTQSAPVERPAAKVFRSRRYRYRVLLPRDVDRNPALASWNTTSPPPPGSVGVDTYVEPDGQNVVVAGPRVGDLTLDRWVRRIKGSAPNCLRTDPYVDTTLAGEPARSWHDLCSDGYDALLVAALHGERGYLLMVVTRGGSPPDQRLLEQARNSFAFTG